MTNFVRIGQMVAVITRINDFFFNLAAVHYVEFLKFNLFASGEVEGLILHQRANFYEDLSSHC